MGSQLDHSPYIVLVESRRKWLLTAWRLFAVPFGFCRRKKIAQVIHTIFNLEAKQEYLGCVLVPFGEMEGEEPALILLWLNFLPFIDDHLFSSPPETWTRSYLNKKCDWADADPHLRFARDHLSYIRSGANSRMFNSTQNLMIRQKSTCMWTFWCPGHPCSVPYGISTYLFGGAGRLYHR